MKQITVKRLAQKGISAFTVPALLLSGKQRSLSFLLFFKKNQKLSKLHVLKILTVLKEYMGVFYLFNVKSLVKKQQTMPSFQVLTNNSCYSSQFRLECSFINLTAEMVLGLICFCRHSAEERNYHHFLSLTTKSFQ